MPLATSQGLCIPAGMLLATSPMYRGFGYLDDLAGSMYVIGLGGATYGIDRGSDSGGLGDRAGRWDRGWRCRGMMAGLGVTDRA